MYFLATPVNSGHPPPSHLTREITIRIKSARSMKYSEKTQTATFRSDKYSKIGSPNPETVTLNLSLSHIHASSQTRCWWTEFGQRWWAFGGCWGTVKESTLKEESWWELVAQYVHRSGNRFWFSSEHLDCIFREKAVRDLQQPWNGLRHQLADWPGIIEQPISG
jgi:hypothetical protein